MSQPVTQYAEHDGHFIAYQVFGQGQVDLLIVPGFISHQEHFWDDPDLARFLEKLAGFARVIMFDKLGTGMSDRDTLNRTVDQRLDEVLAVMEVAGSKRGDRTLAELTYFFQDLASNQDNYQA